MAQRNRNNIVRVIGMLLLTITLACNTGTENKQVLSPEPESLVGISGTDLIAGVVHDQQGKPVAHAQITIYGKTTISDANGIFFVAPIDLFDNRSNIDPKKRGDFFPVQGAYF